MANEASIHSKLVFNRDGMHVKVKGFSSSIKNYLAEFTKYFRALNMHNKEKKLQMYKENYIKELKNYHFLSPLDQGLKYLYALVYHEYLHPEEELELLKTKRFEKEEISKFLEQYLNESQYEWLIQGNINSTEAIEIANLTQKYMQKEPLHPDKTPILRMVKLEDRSFSYFVKTMQDEENQNSGIISYLQLGKLSIPEMSIAKVLENYLSDRFFDSLRTKQQLGYLTSLSYSGHRKVDCFIAQVQSPYKSPEYISVKITEFILENYESILKITEEEFSKHVNSILTMLKAKDLKLSAEVSRNFLEIKYRDYCFDICEKQIEYLERIKREDMIDFYERHFIKEFKRIDVEIVSQCHEEENGLIEAENEFYYTNSLKIKRS